MPSPATPARLGPHRWQDFVALDEDDRRELVDGELVEVDGPTQSHEYVVGLLLYFLTGWVRAHQAGRVLPSGYRVRISDTRGAMPDLQYFVRDNLPIDQEAGLERGRPDLAVEVISANSRSKARVARLHDYASLGVPECWIVDPEARTLDRLVLRGSVYAIEQALAGDVPFRPASFEGLEIPLGELWLRPGE